MTEVVLEDVLPEWLDTLFSVKNIKEGVKWFDDILMEKNRHRTKVNLAVDRYMMSAFTLRKAYSSNKPGEYSFHVFQKHLNHSLTQDEREIDFFVNLYDRFKGYFHFFPCFVYDTLLCGRSKNLWIFGPNCREGRTNEQVLVNLFLFSLMFFKPDTDFLEYLEKHLLRSFRKSTFETGNLVLQSLQIINHNPFPGKEKMLALLIKKLFDSAKGSGSSSLFGLSMKGVYESILVTNEIKRLAFEFLDHISFTARERVENWLKDGGNEYRNMFLAFKKSGSKQKREENKRFTVDENKKEYLVEKKRKLD